jgi:hypothetical protein
LGASLGIADGSCYHGARGAIIRDRRRFCNLLVDVNVDGFVDDDPYDNVDVHVDGSEIAGTVEPPGVTPPDVGGFMKQQ